MAITYPLTIPSDRFASIRIIANDVVGISASPFTLEQQVQRHPGQAWSADIKLPPIRDRDVVEQWAAFLLSLNGREGTFLMGDPTRRTPRGAAGGTPLVKGAGQTGQTLAIDGCPLSTTDWLRAGDYIQLSSGSTARLHRLLTDADTNGSGEVTLDIWPGLRSSPGDNAAVTISSPQGLWRLASNERSWDVGAGMVFGFSFSAVEAL